MTPSPALSDRLPEPEHSGQSAPKSPARFRRTRPAPGARLTGFAAAMFAPIMTLGTLAQFDFADGHPVLLAIVISAASAFVIGLAWPRGAWMWGLWVASGFLLFLGAAFIALLKLGRNDPRPLMEAWVLTVASCAAGSIGGRFRARARWRSNSPLSPR